MGCGRVYGEREQVRIGGHLGVWIYRLKVTLQTAAHCTYQIWRVKRVRLLGGPSLV